MAQQRGSGKAPDLGDYVEVKHRVKEFHERYPEGVLRTRVFEDGMPFKIQLMRQMYTDENSGETREYEQQFIVVVAEAQRKPGEEWFVGSSYEPYPGRTPYTRYSELENAETSAWGRALAALGIGVDKSMASRTEVENRQAERDQPQYEARPTASARTSGTRSGTSARGAASGESQAARPSEAQVRDVAMAILSAQDMGSLTEVMAKQSPAMRTMPVPTDIVPGENGKPMTISQLAVATKNDIEAGAVAPGAWGDVTKGVE